MKFTLRDLIWATLVAALLLVIAISTLDYRTKKKELQAIVQNAIISEEEARANADMAMKAEQKIRLQARQFQEQQELSEQKIADLQRKALAIERLIDSSRLQAVQMFGKTIESTVNAKCVQIIDAYTIECLDDENSKFSVRIESIDTPDRKQPFFQKAKDFIAELCHEKPVILYVTGKDGSGQKLAFVQVDGVDVTTELLKAGLAKHNRKSSDDRQLAGFEAAAQEDKIGIWGSN